MSSIRIYLRSLNLDKTMSSLILIIVFEEWESLRKITNKNWKFLNKKTRNVNIKTDN